MIALPEGLSLFGESDAVAFARLIECHALSHPLTVVIAAAVGLLLNTRRAGEAAAEGVVPGWRRTLEALLRLADPVKQVVSEEPEEAEGFGEAGRGKVRVLHQRGCMWL